MLRLSIWARNHPPTINFTRFLSHGCNTDIRDDRCQTNLALANSSLRRRTLNKLLLCQPITSRDLSTSQILFKDSTVSRLKQMIKDYWYVIIPVEIVTSVMWYGAIFLSLKSGVDIVQVLTNMGVSEQTLRYVIEVNDRKDSHLYLFIASCQLPEVMPGIMVSPSSVTR